jgi:hypothetical protein
MWIRTSLFLHVTRHVSFTHHTASIIPTTKTLLGHPHDISCLGLCTKFTWSLRSLSSELLPTLSRNSAVRVHSQIQKVVTLSQTSGLLQPGSRTHLPGEGPGPPSWMECKILNWVPKLLELIPSRKSGQGNFSWSRGCKHEVTQLNKHASTKWPMVAPPYIPDAVVLAPNPGFF